MRPKERKTDEIARFQRRTFLFSLEPQSFFRSHRNAAASERRARTRAVLTMAGAAGAGASRFESDVAYGWWSSCIGAELTPFGPTQGGQMAYEESSPDFPNNIPFAPLNLFQACLMSMARKTYAEAYCIFTCSNDMSDFKRTPSLPSVVLESGLSTLDHVRNLRPHHVCNTGVVQILDVRWMSPRVMCLVLGNGKVAFSAFVIRHAHANGDDVDLVRGHTLHPFPGSVDSSFNSLWKLVNKRKSAILVSHLIACNVQRTVLTPEQYFGTKLADGAPLPSILEVRDYQIFTRFEQFLHGFEDYRSRRVGSFASFPIIGSEPRHENFFVDWRHYAYRALDRTKNMAKGSSLGVTVMARLVAKSTNCTKLHVWELFDGVSFIKAVVPPSIAIHCKVDELDVVGGDFRLMHLQIGRPRKTVHGVLGKRRWLYRECQYMTLHVDQPVVFYDTPVRNWGQWERDLVCMVIKAQPCLEIQDFRLNKEEVQHMEREMCSLHKSPTRFDPLELLSEDVMNAVLQQPILNVWDICKVRKTCRAWQNLCDTKTLLKSYYMTEKFSSFTFARPDLILTQSRMFDSLAEHPMQARDLKTLYPAVFSAANQANCYWMDVMFSREHDYEANDEKPAKPFKLFLNYPKTVSTIENPYTIESSDEADIDNGEWCEAIDAAFGDFIDHHIGWVDYGWQGSEIVRMLLKEDIGKRMKNGLFSSSSRGPFTMMESRLRELDNEITRDMALNPVVLAPGTAERIKRTFSQIQIAGAGSGCGCMGFAATVSMTRQSITDFIKLHVPAPDPTLNIIMCLNVHRGVMREPDGTRMVFHHANIHHGTQDTTKVRKYCMTIFVTDGSRIVPAIINEGQVKMLSETINHFLSFRESENFDSFNIELDLVFKQPLYVCTSKVMHKHLGLNYDGLLQSFMYFFVEKIRVREIYTKDSRPDCLRIHNQAHELRFIMDFEMDPDTRKIQDLSCMIDGSDTDKMSSSEEDDGIADIEDDSSDSDSDSNSIDLGHGVVTVDFFPEP